MTLEELDEMLVQLKLNMDCEEGLAIKDKILRKFGAHILGSKTTRCNNCWYKEHKGCSSSCELYGLPSDPLEASKSYLARPNDVNMFSFFCLFVVPVYEDVTGEHGTMEKLYKLFSKMWTRKYGMPKSPMQYI